MRFTQGVKPASWLDDSYGCCLPLWYCPFITSTSIASFLRSLGAQASKLGVLPFLLPILLPKLYFIKLFVCKDSANRAKNQIYLSFSEMQPIFETAKQAQ